MNSYVGSDACRLQVTLSEYGVDGSDHNAQPHFFGVYTAYFFSRFCRPGKLLGNHILKINAAFFKTGCVYVGNVVAYYIQTSLVILHSGYSGIK